MGGKIGGWGNVKNAKCEKDIKEVRIKSSDQKLHPQNENQMKQNRKSQKERKSSWKLKASWQK